MAKLNKKFVTVDIRELTVEATLNCRLKGGTVLYGVQVPDTYALDDLKTQIVEVGKIMEPISYSKRSDGSKIVIRGNRRTLAGQALVNDPNISVALREELLKTTAIEYTGLTPQEEIELVNDQDQKRFSRSEIVNQIWHLQRSGYSFNRLALMYWNQLTEWNASTKAAARVKEIEALTNPVEKEQKQKQWLRTTLDVHILGCANLGPRVQRAFWLGCLQVDGLLKENDAKPEFNIVGSSSRSVELANAKKEDGDQWTPENGGPKFNELIEEYVRLDSEGKRRENKSRPSVDDLKTRVANSRSALAKSAFTIAAGDPSEQFPILDENAYLMEQKLEAVKASMDEIDPYAAEILREFIRINTMHDFNEWLKGFKPA